MQLESWLPEEPDFIQGIIKVLNDFYDDRRLGIGCAPLAPNGELYEMGVGFNGRSFNYVPPASGLSKEDEVKLCCLLSWEVVRAVTEDTKDSLVFFGLEGMLHGLNAMNFVRRHIHTPEKNNVLLYVPSISVIARLHEVRLPDFFLRETYAEFLKIGPYYFLDEDDEFEIDQYEKEMEFIYSILTDSGVRQNCIAQAELKDKICEALVNVTAGCLALPLWLKQKGYLSFRRGMFKCEILPTSLKELEIVLVTITQQAKAYGAVRWYSVPQAQTIPQAASHDWEQEWKAFHDEPTKQIPAYPFIWFLVGAIITAIAFAIKGVS